ncbi:hypothetical protein ACFV9W_06935 [Streptomyces sp. NPDC059897]|uniref:hypothetical protein n=1 Tax=Streptomyces sp. NPDC059897 TaxID=3346994 RepID=UPI00364FB186
MTAASVARALPSRVPPARRLPLAVFLSCQACYLFWWAAFHPGLMSVDSVVYTWQVTTDHWRADHSVLYNALVWLSLRATGDLAALTLLQTLAMSAVLAHACAGLRTLGVRGRWSAPAAVACAAAPPLGSFVVFVWKDVPFTICAVLVFAVSVRLVGRRAHGTWTGRPGRSELVLLCTGLLGVDLFRNNGFPVALIAALALVLVLPGARLLIAGIAAATTALTLLLALVIHPAVGIEQPNKAFLYNLHYADLAVTYAQDPGRFTPDDRHLMAQVAPLSTWRTAGTNCYVSDVLYYNASWNRTEAARFSEPLVRLWWRTLRESPQRILDARLCRGHIAWAVFPGPQDKSARTWTYDTQIPADLWGYGAIEGNPYRSALTARPLSSTLHDTATFGRSAFLVPQLEWLLWRGAIWCYAIYALVVLLARARGRRCLLALAGVPLGAQLTVLAANPAPCFRYMAAPMFIGALCLSLIPAIWPNRAPHPDRVDSCAGATDAQSSLLTTENSGRH